MARKALRSTLGRRRARPYFEVKREEVDTDYHVENQVKPAEMRILEVFGVSEVQLGV